ncbi:hypothetical protein AVEN_266793-1 [Araneus ventricosus]|uniref:OTU domain-containing protein n=1 Tax=Araneus ventricosus TaxID=182803 RepID=A0A4Y2GD99_ARAVE|nr:hypothetical protein AVEN_266793-1 [Araneus ventricosus]
MEGGVGQTALDNLSRRHKLSHEIEIIEIHGVVRAGELSEDFTIDPNSSITMACQKYCKIPIVDDGNCLFRAISFRIYGSEDFHTEIHEEVIQNMKTI